VPSNSPFSTPRRPLRAWLEIRRRQGIKVAPRSFCTDRDRPPRQPALTDHFTIGLTPIAKIQPLKDRFDSTTQQAAKLVGAVKTLVKPPPAGLGHPGLPQFQLNLIYELAFVRCVLAWEDFLHTSMCAYLTGARGLSGKSAHPKAKVPTLTVAEELLVGEREFLSWTGKKTVRERAALWLEQGSPTKRRSRTSPPMRSYGPCGTGSCTAPQARRTCSEAPEAEASEHRAPRYGSRCLSSSLDDSRYPA